MSINTTHDTVGLDQLEPSTHPARDAVHFRRILAARRDIARAEQELRDAVKAAREAGDSWTDRCRPRHHPPGCATAIRQELTGRRGP